MEIQGSHGPISKKARRNQLHVGYSITLFSVFPEESSPVN